MFKKIEIWILYLILLLSFLFAIGFGTLVRQELIGTTKLGAVSKTALFLSEIPVYVRDIFVPINERKDKHPELKGFEGTPNSDETYLLLSIYDGDLKDGLVKLIDLTNFNELHVWNPNINEFNDLIDMKDEFKYLNRDKNDKRSFFRHPKLTEEGALLIKEYSPLRKIDSCSNLIFQNTHDIFHHSLETDSDGNIWIPSIMYPQSLSSEKIGNQIKEEGGYFDDAIVKMSPDGEILYEKSVSQIFIDNGLEYLLFSVGDANSSRIHSFDADPIHLNDIQPVMEDSEYWKKGDVFLSLRHQSMVLLYRPSTNEIIWRDTGKYFQQHDVDILDDHRISVFNNNSRNYKVRNAVEGNNEIIIYDFKKDEYSTYLSDSLEKENVKTITEGLSEILPNGDLFVEESNFARTLYFNANGSLRWSHVNRAKNGQTYIIGWSRILYTKEDIELVNTFLSNKGTCNE